MTNKKPTSQLWNAIDNRDVAAAQVAINEGADVNASDIIDNTPLHRAAAFGSVGLVQILLDAGANIAATNYASETPFDTARDLGKSDVAKLLQHASAQPKGHAGRVVKQRSDKGPPQVGG